MSAQREKYERLRNDFNIFSELFSILQRELKLINDTRQAIFNSFAEKEQCILQRQIELKSRMYEIREEVLEIRQQMMDEFKNV